MPSVSRLDESQNGKLTAPLCFTNGRVLSTPSALRARRPCLRGTKQTKNAITNFVPLRQGANEVFREMTKCHFVPHEGSTTQCDAGPARERSGGGMTLKSNCVVWWLKSNKSASKQKQKQSLLWLCRAWADSRRQNRIKRKTGRWAVSKILCKWENRIQI